MKAVLPPSFRTMVPENSKKQKVLPTKNPQILGDLKLKEESLVAALSAAAPGEKHDEAAQALAFFYIHKMKDVAKALPLALVVQDRQILFHIKAHAVDDDPNATPAQKIVGYKRLLQDFPEQKPLLEIHSYGSAKFTLNTSKVSNKLQGRLKIQLVQAGSGWAGKSYWHTPPYGIIQSTGATYVYDTDHKCPVISATTAVG